MANWMRPVAFVVPSVLDRGDRDLLDVGSGGVVGSAARLALLFQGSEDVFACLWLAGELTQKTAAGIWCDPLLGQQVEDRRDHINIGISAHGLLTEADADSVDVAMLRECELDLLALLTLLLLGLVRVLGSLPAPHGQLDDSSNGI